MKLRPAHCIDFYKSGHIFQYPDNTEVIYANFTPRSDRLFKDALEGFWDGKIVFGGLQLFIKHFLIETWNECFFKRPVEEVLAEYESRMDTSLGQGAVPVEHIRELHELGYLPIRIKALPEGSRVPMRVPVITIVNTLPKFYWLTNYLETVASAELWKICTVATIAYEYRKLFVKYASETGAPLDFVPVQGHDFSFRGMSGVYDAATSSIGHLFSFIGTDTVPAIDTVEDYYTNKNEEPTLIGCSIPASEHSVLSAGRPENEIETIRRLIQDVYPSGAVSVVSDTWDYWRVITEYSVALKDVILSRKPNAIGLKKVVFRPDSGDPVKIISGYMPEEVTEHTSENGEVTFTCNETGENLTISQIKGSVAVLFDIFGGTYTDKGYAVLDEHVGLIYGDSITLPRAEQILSRLKRKGFASNNIVFGIGSYTYQYVTRDTFGFAMKATWAKTNGEEIELSKDPATDSGVKKSAKGLLRVEEENGSFVLYDMQTKEEEERGALKTVFEDGKLYNETTIREIRERLQ